MLFILTPLFRLLPIAAKKVGWQVPFFFMKAMRCAGILICRPKKFQLKNFYHQYFCFFTVILIIIILLGRILCVPNCKSAQNCSDYLNKLRILVPSFNLPRKGWLHTKNCVSTKNKKYLKNLKKGNIFLVGKLKKRRKYFVSYKKNGPPNQSSLPWRAYKNGEKPTSI